MYCYYCGKKVNEEKQAQFVSNNLLFEMEKRNLAYEVVKQKEVLRNINKEYKNKISSCEKNELDKINSLKAEKAEAINKQKEVIAKAKEAYQRVIDLNTSTQLSNYAQNGLECIDDATKCKTKATMDPTKKAMDAVDALYADLEEDGYYDGDNIIEVSFDGVVKPLNAQTAGFFREYVDEYFPGKEKYFLEYEINDGIFVGHKDDDYVYALVFGGKS